MHLLLALLSFCFASQAADTPNHHKMVGFGTGPFYVSHLPMYEHGVHRYQAVYEITLRTQPKTRLFGISPHDDFTMPSLKKGSKFSVALHPGHPEETDSTGNTDIEIVRVVYFKPLTVTGGTRPKVLSYFKSGNGAAGETYLSHLLTTPTQGMKTPPDQFDQVVRVVAATKPGTTEKVQIPDGAHITVDTQDTVANRLVKTPDLKHLTRAKIVTASGSTEVLLQIAAEEYLHTGEDVRVKTEE